jgi:hypothetical protein
VAFVVVRYEAVQYDGTNGARIVNDWLDDVKFRSDDGETLVFGIPAFPRYQRYEVPRGYYVLRYYGKTFYQAISPVEYAQNWHVLPNT